MPVLKLLPVLAAVLALLPVATVRTVDGKEAKSGKSSKNKDKDANKLADPSDAIDSMCKMIPEGHRNLKVHYPGFDNGKPTSLVTAAALTRVNPQEMFAEKLRIDLYGKEEKDNMRVDLKTGTYHLDTKMLDSKERSHVSRADFKVDGDSMEFDMTSSQGKMIGNVRMVIYDASSFSASSSTSPKPEKTEKTEKTKAGEQPAAAPAPPAKETTPPGK